MTSKPPAHGAFLTTEEVLEYPQVNLRTVYRLIKSNGIPPFASDHSGDSRSRTSTPGSKAAKREPPVVMADDGSCSWTMMKGTRALLTKMLERDYDVETAIDGPSALEALRKAGAIHDLMISYLNMPGMDGLALIGEVKRLRPELPIIIITGYSTEKSAIDAVNLRVAGYLTKPLRDSQVLEAAARALGAPAA